MEHPARPINVTVNGTARATEVEPRLLLVHFLRENLGLTGTHVGCDTSQCGACTVHLNGAAVKSCTVLAVQADGAEVITIEGLADGTDLHPVQAAFQEEHGLQCGFCTPGMMLTALSYLDAGGPADRPAIRDYMSGNYCRCTGYHAIVDAVGEVAQARAGTRAGKGP